MRATFWNYTALLTMLVVAVGFETGGIEAKNAFFAAFAILVLYVGSLLAARENQALVPVLVSLLTRPTAHSTVKNYVTFVSVSVIGTFVVAHTLV